MVSIRPRGWGMSCGGSRPAPRPTWPGCCLGTGSRRRLKPRLRVRAVESQNVGSRSPPANPLGSQIPRSEGTLWTGVRIAYNIGGHNEWANLRIVELICDLVDEARGRPQGASRSLIIFVNDRPGQDRRYAIDASKIDRELGWRPKHSFETGIRETVDWYLANEPWAVEIVRNSAPKLRTAAPYPLNYRPQLTLIKVANAMVALKGCGSRLENSSSSETDLHDRSILSPLNHG